MRRTSGVGPGLFLALAALLAACGDDATPTLDAGADAGHDAGRDAGVDASDVDAPDCPDVDGDGHGAVPCGDDCDDHDASRHPGATEVCDGDDEDCDDATYGMLDADTDGYTSAACCNGATCGDDCDDSNSDVHPDQVEACNGVDDNCNGTADDGLPVNSYYPDCDGDSYGAMVASVATGCRSPSGTPGCTTWTSPGWATNSADCNDEAASVHPDATEVCNGVDDNCDGTTDEGVTTPWYVDADGDGHGAIGSISRAVEK